MPSRLRDLALLVPLALLPLWGAQAAPQILALMASNEPMPLTCRAGACAVELTTFCLQEDRASPAKGTVYTLIGGEGVRFVATTADGVETPLAVDGDALRITSERTHMSVRLSIPVALLQERGIAHVAALVGEGSTLVPAPAPGDPRPLSEADVALASGPLRALASRFVDRAGPVAGAATLTNRLRNALPWRGRSAPERDDGLWSEVFGDAPATSDRDAMGLARRAYDECLWRSRASTLTMRECLGALHDRFVGGLNNSYWDATKFGF